MYSQVYGIKFGLYTPEELKRISVKPITMDFVLDSNQIPIPDGLYDPSLGPFDQKGVFAFYFYFVFFFVKLFDV
jgi:DNA-directed RNA polymerase I subunit RPA1